MRTFDVPISDVARVSRLISNIATDCFHDQKRFRFYLDDGAINAATAAANEDTDIATAQIALDTNIRLRIQIAETSVSGTMGRASASITLQYRYDGGAYADMNASSSYARSSASSNVLDGAACTRLLTQEGSNAFVDNKYDEVDGAAGSTDLVADKDYEQEFCFQIRSADVADGKVVDFRLLHNGVVIHGYTQTPSYTVAVAAGPPVGSLAMMGCGR